MAEEIRRSGRANKGHHTKHQDDELVPKPAKLKTKNDKKKGAKSGRAQSTQTPEQEEEEDDDEEENALIRCVCGNQVDNGRQMICCEKCEAWQHVRCLGRKEGKHWDTTDYFCEQCKPEDHVELLAAMARGEEPWNPKGKKSKAGKPKSARPSDVKPGVTTEDEKGSTPKPGSTPYDTPTESTNGHAILEGDRASVQQDTETRQMKKDSPPQPQLPSPSREKRRRDALAEKDSAAIKRRKSSAQHHAKAPPQIVDHAVMHTDPADLPEKQRLIVVKFIDDLSKMIVTASKERGFRIPDGETPTSLATRLALQTNYYGVLHLGEPGDNQSPYALQFKSIMFNIKKNTVLLDRLLSGSLKPEGLVTMTTEDMASQEKQREYAAMREAAEKQMVLVEEKGGPRLRKTHKGEEIVGGDEMQVDSEPRPQESVHAVNIQGDQKAGEVLPVKADGSPSVELPEDLARRGSLAVDTTTAAGSPGAHKSSATFDIQSVYNKVRTPQGNQQPFLPRRQSSIAMQDKVNGPGEDADIDRLLKDEDNDVSMNDFTQDPSVVWQGTVDMQSIGPFEAVARLVAGGDFGQALPWNKLLSSTLPIQGRIESAKGDEYIQGLERSETHDVSVLSLSPLTEEGRKVMDTLFEYFHPRDRWGVVPDDKLASDAMRDLYVIPVPAGGSNLPPFLDMLEYSTIETPRPHNMVLLALVAKLPETAQQQQPSFAPMSTEMTPGQPGLPTNGAPNGPSPSPVPNPHGPAFSPLQSAFPSAPSYGNPFSQTPPNIGHAPQAEGGHDLPPHRRNPKAVEIFGPYIDAPVVVQLLTSQSFMPQGQMENLRYIMDTVPEARTNTKALMDHMTAKEQQHGQGVSSK